MRQAGLIPFGLFTDVNQQNVVFFQPFIKGGDGNLGQAHGGLLRTGDGGRTEQKGTTILSGFAQCDSPLFGAGSIKKLF
ncbi:hypothetical protein GCM10027396_17800 [Insolitispirillum peregrinum]